MDADARNNGGPVLQAEGGEVQTAGEDKKHKKKIQRSAEGLLFACVHAKYTIYTV